MNLLLFLIDCNKRALKLKGLFRIPSKNLERRNKQKIHTKLYKMDLNQSYKDIKSDFNKFKFFVKYF